MLSKLRRFKKLFAIMAIGMAVSVTAVDLAEARRASSGSSFGSRGTRTYSRPPRPIPHRVPRPASTGR